MVESCVFVGGGGGVGFVTLCFLVLFVCGAVCLFVPAYLCVFLWWRRLRSIVATLFSYHSYDVFGCSKTCLLGKLVYVINRVVCAPAILHRMLSPCKCECLGIKHYLS